MVTEFAPGWDKMGRYVMEMGWDGKGYAVGVATEIEIEAAEARVIAPGDRRGRGAASFQLEAGEVP
ncbi:unnamed protein product [Clonostachys solani]|uniref:Uncharacterized protein n=1 Tax=Clonostachys solani TaxID=160281 RepID=A0A9N9W9E6_9HYPO|nr:unnamed protein product [Clonostachys solani]